MSTDRWTDKEDVVYVYNWLPNHKKEWNTAICSNMDYHTKLSSQAEKDKYQYNIAYIQNLFFNDTNELIYKTETDTKN